MDSIIPEKDELDSHQSKKSRVRSSVEAARPESTVKVDDKSVRLSRSAQWALILMFILVIALVAMGYWQVNSQQQTIQTLDGQLAQANNYISQSKLIVARLEGQINQTDATMAQSGNEMARELKFLDSEMRKLWDVSNKRNRDWIQNNQKGIKTLSVELEAIKATADEILISIAGLNKGISEVKTGFSKQSAELASQRKLAEQQGVLLENQQKSIDLNLVSVEKSQALIKSDLEKLQDSNVKLTATQKALTDQLVSSISELDKKILAQEKSVKADPGIAEKLNSIEAEIKAMRTDISTNQSSLTGHDKTIRQLVQRFIQLDERINELQLQMNAIQSGAQVSAAQ